MTATHPDPAARRAELADNVAAVRERIAAAASACERDPASITLIAVTKTYPATDVALLADLGMRDIGENREQEAARKAAELAAAGVEVRWHHIGQLQRNKARSVCSYASWVHSADRLSLVTALGRARADAIASGLVPVPLNVLIQVNLDPRVPPGHVRPDGERGGADPSEVPALAAAIASYESLNLAGVMAVAPLGEPPSPAFARLAAVSSSLISEHPQATAISAGMSADLEEAIAAGATHVRIGSALLGPRPKLG